jgi:hypothetical protein
MGFSIMYKVEITKIDYEIIKHPLTLLMCKTWSEYFTTDQNISFTYYNPLLGYNNIINSTVEELKVEHHKIKSYEFGEDILENTLDIIGDLIHQGSKVQTDKDLVTCFLVTISNISLKFDNTGSVYERRRKEIQHGLTTLNSRLIYNKRIRMMNNQERDQYRLVRSRAGAKGMSNLGAGGKRTQGLPSSQSMLGKYPLYNTIPMPPASGKPIKI